MSWREFGVTGVLRLLAFVVLAAFLFVLQLDKASEKRASMANLVLPGLGGFADVQAAQRSIQNNPAEAARRLDAVLRNRPIEAEHLSLFALWAVEQDDPRASTALTSAAKRGWRDPYTQLTVLGSAVASGQIDAAVARLDALGRLKLDQQAYSIALGVLIESEEGREAVAARMIDSDYLFRRFLHYVKVQEPVSEASIAAFEQAVSLDPDMPCELHGAMAGPILAGGNIAEVRRVWPRRCGAGNPTDIAFDFEESNENEFPLAWKLRREPGLSIRPAQKEGAVTVINRDPIRRVFARRYLTLSSGRYALRVSTPQLSATTPGFRTATLGLRAECVKSPGERRPLLFAIEGEPEVIFEVPSGCGIQHLAATASRGKAENVSLSLERVGGG